MSYGRAVVLGTELTTPRSRAAIHSSAARGARWILDLQQHDGSLQGAVSLGDYYKVPFALAASGHLRECDRTLDYVSRKFLLGDGDLRGQGLSWFELFRIYPHSWLCIASLMRGRFEVAYPLLRFIITHFDCKSGGFFATSNGREQKAGNQEVMSTSLAGLACLWAGNVSIALMVGRWMKQLYDAQPDVSKGLYHVWHSENGLVRNFSKEDAVSFLIDSTATRQWYFQYGISAAFLSCLYAATKDEGWLRLAQQYLRASRHCREDVYLCPTSGKIGWGSAWTYRYTSDPEDKRRAETVANGLIALQREDGSWLSASEEADGGINIDETAEFVGFQSAISLIVE